MALVTDGLPICGRFHHLEVGAEESAVILSVASLDGLDFPDGLEAGSLNLPPGSLGGLDIPQSSPESTGVEPAHLVRARTGDREAPAKFRFDLRRGLEPTAHVPLGRAGKGTAEHAGRLFSDLPPPTLVRSETAGDVEPPLKRVPRLKGL